MIDRTAHLRALTALLRQFPVVALDRKIRAVALGQIFEQVSPLP